MSNLIFFIILIGTFVYIYYKACQSQNKTINYQSLSSYFDKLTTIYRDLRVTIYSGDKDAENFLIETSTYSNPITLSDIMLLINTAQKKHVHNKIIITNFPIDEQIRNSKTFKENEITIWNSEIVNNLIKDSNIELKTSDTSDDTCDIDTDYNDPIQDGAFSTHSIFSIFNNKVDHL